MGLDIHLAEGPLKKIAERTSAISDDDYDALYEQGYPIAVLGGPWKYHEPLQDGAVYIGEGRSDHFRAGSYSGYNRWREELSKFAFDRPPEEVWEHPEKYAGKPFYEVVHFSDCEGTIGPEVAAKLAADFEKYRGAAKTTWHVRDSWNPPPEEEWRLQLYDAFWEFFKRAAETQGAVQWS